MAIANLFNQQNGFKINGIIEDYYVYAGENVTAESFVEFVNGIASSSTETSVDTLIGNTGYDISACKLSGNRVFIATGTNADLTASDNYLTGIVCVINGHTITKETSASISTSTFTGAIKCVVALSESSVFIAHSYGSSYYLYGVVCTIDSTTGITTGTDTAIFSDAQYGRYISAVSLGGNKVFLSYSLGTSYYAYCVVCSISGTTITVGSSVKLGNKSSSQYMSAMLLSTDKVFVALGENTSYHYLYGIVCTISGTTISKGSLTSLVTGGYVYKRFALKLSENSVFIAYGQGPFNKLYGIVCTISGTTITAGESTAIGSSVNYTGQDISCELLNNGNVFVAHSYDSTCLLYGVVCFINGTIIVSGTDTVLSQVTNAGFEISSQLLKDDIVFIAHSFNSGYALYGQVWGVENNVPTNQIIQTTYETQVRPTTTSEFYGVAKSSGMGGTNTSHNEKVSIYTL